MSGHRKFVSLGMFIVDEFVFLDHAGNPTTRTLEPQEGLLSHIQHSHIGYFFYRLGEVAHMPILARASGKVFDLSTPHHSDDRSHGTRLPPSETGMIVDRGIDFPPEMDAALRAYGEDMWLFRDQSPAGTTRAVNRYQGDHRGCATYFLACFLLHHGISSLTASAPLAIEKVFSTSHLGCESLRVTFSVPVFPIRRPYISYVRPHALPSSCRRWPKSKAGPPYLYTNLYQ